MLRLLIAAIGAAAVAYPQARIGIRPTMSGPQSTATGPKIEAARPLLGYVSDRSNDLYSVVGSFASPAWGEPITLPDATSQAFLPPRQEYALLASDAGLSVARLSRSALYPGPLVANAIARPDRVVFSPLGWAAVLVSDTERRIQTVIYRSGNASVLWSLGFSDPGELLNFAVSDDGELLVATFANQPPLYSLKGSRWQPLATSYTPGAWTFLPDSHDLVLSDRSENAIILLPHAEDTSIAARVLLPEGGDANLIAADKQGTNVLAAINGTSNLWKIELGSGMVQHLSSRGAVTTLTSLRDGETFLISLQEPPGVVNLTSNEAQSWATAGVH